MHKNPRDSLKVWIKQKIIGRNKSGKVKYYWKDLEIFTLEGSTLFNRRNRIGKT